MLQDHNNDKAQFSPFTLILPRKSTHSSVPAPCACVLGDGSFLFDTVAVLKAHTDEVTGVAFAPNNKYLASVSADRTLRFWPIDAFTKNDKEHASIDFILCECASFQMKCAKVLLLTWCSHKRVNTELDHGLALAWTSDSSHVVLALSQNKTVAVYRVHERKVFFSLFLCVLQHVLIRSRERMANLHLLSNSFPLV